MRGEASCFCTYANLEHHINPFQYKTKLPNYDRNVFFLKSWLDIQSEGLTVFFIKNKSDWLVWLLSLECCCEYVCDSKALFNNIHAVKFMMYYDLRDLSPVEA